MNSQRGRVRDSQRSRVYEAGWSFASTSGYLGERSARVLLRSLGCSLSWNNRRNSSEHASGWADSNRALVRLSPNKRGAVSMEVLLHEVAHVWTPTQFAWHGPEFCRVLLDLTERVQGWNMRMGLAGVFTKFRVKVAPAGSVKLRWDLKRWEWPKATKKSLKL